MFAQEQLDARMRLMITVHPPLSFRLKQKGPTVKPLALFVTCGPDESRIRTCIRLVVFLPNRIAKAHFSPTLPEDKRFTSNNSAARRAVG